MKNYILLRITFVTAVILISIGFVFLYKNSSPFSFAASDASRKTDRLFRDLGILPHPRLTVPSDIKLKDLNGKDIRLSDFKGNIVFLNFWTTWCPDCRIEMPSMEKLHNRFKDKNFDMITINLKEPAERVKNFFETYKLTFVGLLDPDGKVTSKMAVRALPTTLVIDKNGKILGMAMGSRPWNGNKSVALFEHLISQ